MFGKPTQATAAHAVFLTAAPHGSKDAGALAARERALAASGTDLVHLLASSLRVDQSLATAVRFAASHASGTAAEELERLEWAVRLRHFASIDEGFLAFADAAGRADPELKRALVTLHGAESEATREGLERRLDRAYDVVVRSEERRRAKLSQSLERPAQTLFGIGVVLPLVLAALLPMLQMGGSALPAPIEGALLVVVVPVATLVASSRLLTRNFLGARLQTGDARRALGAAAGPLVAGLASLETLTALGFSGTPVIALTAAAIAGTAMAAGLRLARRAGPSGGARAALDRDLPDLLHTVGTKMAAGRPAEHALLETVEASAGSELSKRLRGVLFDVIVGRRSLGDALERDAEMGHAARVLPALRLLATTADRDTEVAARVVLHLAEFERLRAEAVAALRTKLKGFVESTRATTCIFAPLILGITAGMFGLLSRVGTAFVPGAPATSGGSDVFAVTVALYLAAQVALSNWFGARLASESPLAAFARGMARDVPLAMGLFALAALGSSLVL